MVNIDTADQDLTGPLPTPPHDHHGDGSLSSLYDTVTVVDTPEAARRALDALYLNPGTIHSCDTEVANIDLKQVGPVGNGDVICVSIYSGPDVDFGEGKGKTLWIDNLDAAHGILQEFKAWFEDPAQKKVWHNYGFDRHVMFNEGIDVQGFAGDTMHMARLADSSRDRAMGAGGKGYSLEALTDDLLGRRKVPMKEIFGQGKLLSSGERSKVKILPPVEELQRNSATSRAWIEYSAYDAEGTYLLYQNLVQQLLTLPWPECLEPGRTMLDFYNHYLVDFGETLTDMERRGIRVDVGYLQQIEAAAFQDKEKYAKCVQEWLVSTCGPGGQYMNAQSSAQMQTLLFGGCKNQKTGEEGVPPERVIKVEITDPEEIADLEKLERHRHLVSVGYVHQPHTGAKQGGGAPLESELTSMKIAELKGLCRDRQLALTGNKAELVQRLLNGVGGEESQDQQQEQQTSSSSSPSLPAAELSAMTVATLKGLCRDQNLPVSGKKALLIDRLTAAAAAASQERDGTAASTSSSSSSHDENQEGGEVPQDDGVSDVYSSMTNDDLMQALRVKGLECATEPRPTLLKFLRDDDDYRHALRQQLMHGSSGAAAPSYSPSRPIIGEVRGSMHAAAADPVSPGMTSPGGGDVIPGILDPEEVTALEAKFGAVTGRPGAKRYREITIRSIGLEPTKFTAQGQPSVTMAVLRDLAGEVAADGRSLDAEKPGRAYRYFGGDANREEALRSCEALHSLCLMGSVDTMLASFIRPLQDLSIDSRVHCSMNLNTETGRLSARRPNLQNQPALDKDQYKIRDAFTAGDNQMLVVADYGQLELRLLAHMANCKSMLEAFKTGGCFHSRTALGMFDHIKKAVEEGTVLLEWDYSKGDKPPVPLVKDVYAAERRKAKTLNFSIAYGKTAHGLSKDWGVSVQEANELLEAWYADRPEVKAWQLDTIRQARRTTYTRTLMGRYRKLPNVNSRARGPKGHSERAAINTPIQGGAADVVMMAMVNLNKSEKLKRLGYRLLLQIHDEVIMEGPEENVEEALRTVKELMENPFDEFGLDSLRVPLEVDAKYEKTWYRAK